MFWSQKKSHLHINILIIISIALKVVLIFSSFWFVFDLRAIELWGWKYISPGCVFFLYSQRELNYTACIFTLASIHFLNKWHPRFSVVAGTWFLFSHISVQRTYLVVWPRWTCTQWQTKRRIFSEKFERFE